MYGTPSPHGALQSGQLIEFADRGTHGPGLCPGRISRRWNSFLSMDWSLRSKANTGPADTRGHFSWNVWGPKVLQTFRLL